MKPILNLLILITLSNGMKAQSDFVKLWDYTYGGDNGEVLNDLIKTSDGGFLLVGYSSSSVSGNKSEPARGGNDYWIVKTDASGVIQWEKTYGGTLDDFLYSANQTTDGGYILGGYSYSDSSADKTKSLIGVCDYWIIKTDAQGNFEWDQVFGGTDVERFYSVRQTTDKGYLLAGFSTSGINGNKTDTAWGQKDFWVVKTDSSGIKLWDKSYGSTGDDWLTDMEVTTDNGFIVGGFSNGPANGTKTQNTWGFYDYWVVKADSAGNYQWDKDFGGTSIDGIFSLVQTNDGGYLFGGTSLSDSSGDKTQDVWGAYDWWLVRTDSAGNKLWDRDFGGTENEEVFGLIDKTPDNGYLISGCSYSDISGDKTEANLGMEQTWLLKFDDAGNKLWDKTVFSLAHDETGFAIYAGDSSYVVANYSSSQIGGYKSQPPWNGTDDYWILLLADSSFVSGYNFISQPENAAFIYPNPNNGTFRFMLNPAANPGSKVQAVIYNSEGKIVYDAQLNNTQQLIMCPLSQGVYFVKLISDNSSLVCKMIVKE